MTSELTLDALNKERRNMALYMLAYGVLATTLAWRVTWIVTYHESIWCPALAAGLSGFFPIAFVLLGYPSTLR